MIYLNKYTLKCAILIKLSINSLLVLRLKQTCLHYHKTLVQKFLETLMMFFKLDRLANS